MHGGQAQDVNFVAELFHSFGWFGKACLVHHFDGDDYVGVFETLVDKVVMVTGLHVLCICLEQLEF